MYAFLRTLYLFDVEFEPMRLSHCSDPIPPRSTRVRGKICVIRKGKAIENRAIKVINSKNKIKKK